MIPLLKIQNLCKTFNIGTANESTLFNRLALDVNNGDFVTIIGSNGAGKSSLLNIISGTLDCDAGSISLDDKEISNLPEYKRTRVIGRVFQDPSFGVSPSMTILENLSIAYNKGKKYNLSMGINKRNIDYFKEVLSQLSLGLEDKINVKAGLLSGGQRQALSLVMACISNPKLLLLDEHTAALDPKTSERIVDLTDKIVKERGIATLMVTHNLNQAISMGNRLIMMHRGEIVLDMSGKEKEELNIDKLLQCFENSQSNDLFSDRILFS